MKNRLPARFATAMTVIALSVATLPPAAADSSIRVLVNDQPITSFDIEQRLKLMAIAHEKGGIKDATDQLINELIEIGDGRKHGIVVPDSRVDDAFAQISTGMKLTPDQLTKALANQGV